MSTISTNNPPVRIARPYRQALTLLELLTVIAIIAVLAALLVPVFSAMRTSVRSLQCASNQRIACASVFAYSADNANRIPYMSDISGALSAFWAAQGILVGMVTPFERCGPYLDDTYRENLYSGNNIYHCPNAIAEIPDRVKWKFLERFSFQYSMNCRLVALYRSNGNVLEWYENPGVCPTRPLYMSRVRGSMVMMMDGALLFSPSSGYYFGSTIAPSNRAWPIIGSSYHCANPASPPAAPVEGAIIDHGRRVNIIYADGHASTVSGIWRASEMSPRFELQ